MISLVCFKNGTDSTNGQGQDNITIKNLGVKSSGSTTLAAYGGWICQPTFGRGAANNNIVNCYSLGAISGIQAGGICGVYAGHSGHLTITNCYSEGAISRDNAGGICGYSTGYSSGTVTRDELLF